MGIASTQAEKKYKIYAALLTQTGNSTEDVISGGTLTIGVTYYINQDSPGMDFTNVGAPNNNVGTIFVANGTTPNSWGSGADYTLAYAAGAPVVNVLENTLGDITWRYDSVGNYSGALFGQFTSDKTFMNNQALHINQNTGPFTIVADRGDDDTIYITTNPFMGSPSDDLLFNTPIEIRIYK